MIDVSAGDIVQRTLKRGCHAAEVFIRTASGISVEAKDGKVEALEASHDLGIALKVIKNKKIGFAFTTSYEEIEKTIDEAVQGADWTGADEYNDIAECMPPCEVLNLDEEIRHLEEEKVIEDAILLEKSTLSFDSRIRRVRKAEVNSATAQTMIANSKGVDVVYESSYYSAHVTALAQDESGDSQMGWDYAGSRRLSDINIKQVGENTAARAIELLGSRKISPVKAPVIISPSVAVDFLEILSKSLSAEAVLKQRSFLAGKIKKEIVSPLFDIIDDGTMPWGTGTRPVDDEGVAVRNKTLISRGVLEGFIHNTYTARKEGIVSTGNASRPSAKGLAGIDVTNLYLKPADAASDRGLIKSVSRGIMLLGAMGVHTANPVSGDFSVGISGLWIENGEAVYPFREAVLSGNILEMFRKVEGVGSDLKFYGSIGSPSLLIGEMDISA